MRNTFGIILIFLLFLSGCIQEEQDFTGDSTIEGYLVHVEDKEILVVNGITKEQAAKLSWNELFNKNDKQYHAHVFHIDGFFGSFSEFKKGQKVRVWGEGGASESYPPQSDLGKIELVE